LPVLEEALFELLMLNRCFALYPAQISQQAGDTQKMKKAADTGRLIEGFGAIKNSEKSVLTI